MRETLKAFRVLSDETKMRILNIILERECCVCEISQALDISQSRASRGLTALYDAGFLRQRKEGLWSLYTLDKENISGYKMQLVKAVRQALDDNEKSVLDKERLKTATRNNVLCPPGRFGKATA